MAKKILKPSVSNNDQEDKAADQLVGKTQELIGNTLQNPAINGMFKLNSKRNTKKNYNRELVVKFDAVTAVTTKTRLGLPEQVMLDYIIDKYAQTPDHDNNKVVKFTLKDYMKDTKRADAKSARNSLRKCLDTLLHTVYSYSGGTSKNPYNQNFGGHHILDYDYKRGQVTIDFSDFFFDLLVHGTMPMPHYKIIYQLDPINDATTIYVLRALEVNKRINKPKKKGKNKKKESPARGDRIKVKTLLHDVPSLATHDELKKSNDRHTYKRLVVPILNAVEQLADPKNDNRAIDEYCFIDANNNELDYENLDYDTFAKSTLIIKKWHNYPEELLEKWSEKQKKIRDKQKKQATKKKK